MALGLFGNVYTQLEMGKNKCGPELLHTHTHLPCRNWHDWVKIASGKSLQEMHLGVNQAREERGKSLAVSLPQDWKGGRRGFSSSRERGKQWTHFRVPEVGERTDENWIKQMKLNAVGKLSPQAFTMCQNRRGMVERRGQSCPGKFSRVSIISKRKIFYVLDMILKKEIKINHGW